MTERLRTTEGHDFFDIARRLWRAKQITTTSALALAAAILLTPAVARAADCPDGENPVGSTCNTDTALKTLDSLVPTYNNKGTFNNTSADGVKLDDAAAVFTNNGSFNNNAAGALNFNAAGATFINNGTFNSNVVGGIVLNADGIFINSGTFNDISADSFTGGNLAFTNAVGGVFNAYGGTINLGSGTFTNHGLFNLGANATVGTQTSITGNYDQSSTGTLRLRTNWGAGIADNLNVSGDATLAGKIAPIHTGVSGLFTQTFTILNAAGTLTDGGLTVANTATVANSLVFGANSVTLNSTINFLGVGGPPITGNAATMANTINTLFTNGASMPFVSALISIPSTAEYVRALQSLGPVADANLASSTLSTSATFANQLLSCRVAGENDAYAIIREGQCAWARMTGRRTTVGSTDNGPGVSESAMLVSTGAQFNLGGPWRIGGGVAYEEPTTSNAIARTETRRVHLGGVVKYNSGPWLFALGVNGGWGSSDNTRFVSFGGFNAAATSSNDSDYLSGRFTSAYLMQVGSFYVKPQMDIVDTYINRGGYTESATGGIALNVQGTSLSVLSYSPSVEVGMQMPFANNSIMRPYAKVGGTWRDKSTLSTTASFADPALAGTSFAMVSRMDKSFLDIGSGVDIIVPGETVIRLQYDGQYGETVTSHSGSAKFSLKF